MNRHIYVTPSTLLWTLDGVFPADALRGAKPRVCDDYGYTSNFSVDADTTESECALITAHVGHPIVLGTRSAIAVRGNGDDLTRANVSHLAPDAMLQHAKRKVRLTPGGNGNAQAGAEFVPDEMDAETAFLNVRNELYRTGYMFDRKEHSPLDDAGYAGDCMVAANVSEMRFQISVASMYGIHVHRHPTALKNILDAERPSCFVGKLFGGAFAGDRETALGVIADFYEKKIFRHESRVTPRMVESVYETGVVQEEFTSANALRVVKVQPIRTRIPTLRLTVGGHTHVEAGAFVL
jgi:hypothetical protein